MRHRSIARQRVVLERQPTPLMRQRVEPAVLHRLADLSLDERLAQLLARRLGRIGTLWISLPAHGPRVTQRFDIQAVAARR